MGEIIRLFDSYNRTARVFPAILLLAPPVLTVMLVSGAWMFRDIGRGVIFAFICISGVYLVASFARQRGKAIEPVLMTSWGGLPTTALVRHADQQLDSYTKERYRAALSKLCPDLELPSPELERLDPTKADAIYGSAVRRLIEQRRDRRFDLVHAENASYGFRRNMLGVKPFAIGLALGSAIVVAALWLLPVASVPSSLSRLTSSTDKGWFFSTIIICDLLIALMWALLITREFVFHSAKDYALGLLRTLDAPKAS
jgi:hypothetical protein